MNLGIRIISSKECQKCKAFLKELDLNKVVYTVYDADAEENESQLDDWEIVDMPVVHIVDLDTGKIMHPFQPGRITIFSLRMKIDSIQRRNK